MKHRRSTAVKSISIAFGLMFIIFAGLQFNDPDPEIWASAYFLVSAICWWNAFSKVPILMSISLILGAMIWAYFQWPETYNGIRGAMTPDTGIEEARESLGLIICAIAILFVLLSTIKIQKSEI